MEEKSLRIHRCDSSNKDFEELVNLLDSYLAIVDGEDHAFYDQYNGISAIKYAIVLYHNNLPVACGAIKAFNSESMEVKRMYVCEDSRGKGFATYVLTALEKWAVELGYKSTVLETGRRQVAAVALYKKTMYYEIDNFEPYIGMKNSVCFKKNLKTKL